MNHLKTLIAEQLVNQRISREAAKELLRALALPVEREEIAVIGMAGRFAVAQNVDEFWELLKLGKPAIRDFPPHRQADMHEVFRNPSYAELILGAAVVEADLPYLYAKSGYLDRIDTFDAAYFGIPPLEADYMDPNQRIALEVATEAIEDAGYGGVASYGSRTGVFLGRDHSNFSFYRMTSERHPMQLSGSWEGLAASRISYLFDFKGPCLVIDTACSAGAVSIHQAIHSLLAGECDMALAGGINLSSIGEPRSAFMAGATMDSVESEDETIRTFDARANGTLWGEGVGMVMLKPLRRAVADRDNIRAVIKATACNNDGSSNSITAPDALAQEQVILDAWSRAGINPETISYVEAHGTGTVLGDPIEVKGLTNAFRRHTNRRQFCAIGSLKTSMGHMVAASGVASVIKVVRSMESRMLAPSVNFEVPNPYINFPEGPLFVNDELRPWESDGPRRAVINSFGFIRTNCHLVLEEAPVPQHTAPATDRYCLTISTRSAAAQAQLLERYSVALRDTPWAWQDVCYTSNVGRAHHEHRTIIVARSLAELREALDWASAHPGASDPARGIHQGHHRVVSDKRRDLEPGDVTGAQQRSLTDRAAGLVQRYRTIRHPHDLVEMAALYAQGAMVDFVALHMGDERQRVSLPTYPFELARHWAPPMVTAVKTAPAVVASESTSLVGELTHQTNTCWEFERTLGVDEWVLADHRIAGRSVLPGTAYLEMVRSALAQITGSDRLCFQNVIFLQPLTVDDAVPTTLRTRLNAEDGGYRFVVSSQVEDNSWVSHAEGRVEALNDPAPEPLVALEAVKENAVDVVDPFVGEAESNVFTFGPHWDVVRAIWRGEDFVVARYGLSEGLGGETAQYRLHPSLLDNAVNLISQTGEYTYLPYVYRSLRLYGPMPETFHSILRVVRDGVPGDETITYDVDLVDEEGRVFVRVEDYTVKKVDWNRFAVSDDGQYLQLTWIPSASGPEVAVSAEAESRWAVVVSDSAAGSAVLDAVSALPGDIHCYRLGGGEDVFATDRDGMETLVSAWQEHGVDGIAWLVDPTEEADPLDPARGERLSALFDAAATMVAHRFQPALGLRVAVQGAAQVSPYEVGSPFGSATMALTRVIAQEYPHLGARVVDFAMGVPVGELLQIVEARNVVVQAWRGDTVLVPRLEARKQAAPAPDEVFAGGTYVVTGGCGGLGAAVAHEMVRQGAQQVILLGRRPAEETGANVLELPGVEYRQCDMADVNAVNSLIDELETRGILLDGIVHAAGIAGAGYLAGKTRKAFEDVLRPKVAGGLGALALARRHPGSFLVLFASITGVVGGQGQGDYASANAFLDGLASLAHAEGIAAVAIDWPSWAEVGMAVENGVTEDDSLVRPISVLQGLAWLQRLVREPVAGVVPGVVNLTVAQEYADELGSLLELEATTASSSGEQEDEGHDVRIKGLGDPSEVHQRIANAFGAILGLDEVDAYAGFQELGGNSLMTTQLLKLIDRSYPGAVDIADLFSYPNVADLAGFVADKLAAQRDTVVTVAPVAQETVPADRGAVHDLLRDVLDEMGDSDLSNMFGSNDGEKGGS